MALRSPDLLRADKDTDFTVGADGILMPSAVSDRFEVVRMRSPKFSAEILVGTGAEAR